MKPNGKCKHRNFNDLKTETMTDNEIKEDCLQEAGIDLGRYSHKELTEIKDALRRYHQAKLKLLGIADVSNCGGAIPYDNLSDSFKKSIDSIEDKLNK
tara:strand:+ start:704 stop:997 length:294 start_codon:yes stop_codon:yes gene_type:complete